MHINFLIWGMVGLFIVGIVIKTLWRYKHTHSSSHSLLIGTLLDTTFKERSPYNEHKKAL